MARCTRRDSSSGSGRPIPHHVPTSAGTHVTGSNPVQSSFMPRYLRQSPGLHMAKPPLFKGKQLRTAAYSKQFRILLATVPPCIVPPVSQLQKAMRMTNTMMMTTSWDQAMLYWVLRWHHAWSPYIRVLPQSVLNARDLCRLHHN